jgi:S-methylmethionine-dependent homocysteine/selenocysteine methylase
MSSSSSSSSSPSALSSHLERLRSNKQELLFLDGGTGEELFRRGVPDDRKIWSATAVVNEQYHKTLKDVHKSFIDSGSHAITTNSYGITPGVGFSRDDVIKYVDMAGRLARESTKEGDDTIIIFGSLGPLVESYRPDLVSEHKRGVEDYQVMAAALAPHVDCFLAETMSSIEEASQAIEAVGTLGEKVKLPIMVSFTLNRKGKIRTGESLVEAIPKVVQLTDESNVDLVGVLVNCAEPEAVTKAFQEVRSNISLQDQLDERHLLLGAYANRLTPVPDQWSLETSEEAQAMREDLSPNVYFDQFVNIWVNDLEVQVIGGCCGITPEHIQFITSHMSKDA